MIMTDESVMIEKTHYVPRFTYLLNFVCLRLDFGDLLVCFYACPCKKVSFNVIMIFFVTTCKYLHSA